MPPDIGELTVVDAPGQERFEIRGDKDPIIGFTAYQRRGGARFVSRYDSTRIRETVRHPG